MIFCFRASSQAWVISNCVFYTLCCHTSLLLVDVVDPSGITGKYPSCCGRLNANAYRIRYRDGRMTTPSKPFPLPPRSLWIETEFVFSLKWASYMFLYVVSHSTFVGKGIGNKDLMSVAFAMVMMINTNFMCCSLVVCTNAVRKRIRRFGIINVL